MKREGPCRHCGIAHTPLWRSGPREKPVLCNACGSRWRIRGTLVDYTPKHASKETRGRKPKYGMKVAKPDIYSVCFEDDTTNRSSSGSTSSSETCIRTGNINGSDDLNIWNRESIPRRKRSVLRQRILSTVERLHKDLLQMKYQQEPLKQSADDDVLIYNNINSFSPPTETAYGAMLLKSPSKPTSPFTGKSIPLSNQVAQKYKYSPYMCTRGTTYGDVDSSGPIWSHSRDPWTLESSTEGWREIYIQSQLPSAEVGAAFPSARDRGHQVQGNQALEGANREPTRAFRVQMPLGFPILDSSSAAINPTSLFSPIREFNSTHFQAVEPVDLLVNDLRKLSLRDSDTEGGNQLATHHDSELGGHIEGESQLVDIPLFSDLDLFYTGMD